MTFNQLTAAVAAAAAIIVSACGGGGGGEGGGIGGTGISYGSVSALGSVWVNGVEFNTDNSAIRIDDRPGVPSEVKVGMVVRVDGSIDAKRADSVAVEGSIKGLVEGVGPNNIVVMGQSIRIDDRTCGDGPDVKLGCGALRAVQQGERVEVHGLVVADGLVSGTYVVKPASAPNPLFAVKGLVKNHVPAANKFDIGALTVNYAGASGLAELGAAPWNGLLVEAKGSVCSGAVAPACGSLTASAVKLGGLRVDNSAQVEAEGFVTNAAPNPANGSSFTIGTQPVSTSAGTIYVGGAAADVLLGAKLEVEGAVRGGVLVATKVRFLDSIRIEAVVVSSTGGNLTLQGLPGVTVTANALTEFQGGITAVTDLVANNIVRLRARPAPGGGVVAMQLERRNGGGNNRTVLQAVVDAVNAPGLTLLGVSVDTTPVLDANFLDTRDQPLGRAGFFAAVKKGSLVKVRGTFGVGGLVLDEVEFEE